MNYLAIDIGATSGRAILGVLEDGRVTIEEIARFPNRMIREDGHWMWDIQALYDSVIKALKTVADRNIGIESVGIDTWGVDFGFVADDGSLLGNPRAYRDPYTEGIPEEVFRTVPREELYAATGIQIMNFNSIFQLYAQTKEDFAPLLNARNILFIYADRK